MHPPRAHLALAKRSVARVGRARESIVALRRRDEEGRRGRERKRRRRKRRVAVVEETL